MDAPQIRPAGDAAVLVTLGSRIDPAVNALVRTMTNFLRETLDLYERTEVIPSYATVLIRYDPEIMDYDMVVDVVRGVDLERGTVAATHRTYIIPVAYGGEYGPDLEDLARLHNLSAEAVIDLHANHDYVIYGLGFSPGFPFLGGLDPSLHTPRLETPRSRVPAGSVAIGGEQTGVYPTPTPGGWRLIGRTPLRLFNIDRSPPVLYEPGDRLRFVPISPEEYQRLREDPQLPTALRVESQGV